MKETIKEKMERNGFSFKGENSFVYKYLDAYNNYRAVIVVLKEIVGHDPEWNDLTDENLEEFVKRLNRFSESTRATFVQSLKKIMNDNAVPSSNFNTILVSKYAHEKNPVYLSNIELEKIDSYVPVTEYERIAKRIFMIMALCGCDMIDAINMNQNDIVDRTNTLFYMKEKNMNEVSVPIHRLIKKYILEECSESFFESHRRTILRALKSIMKNSGITDVITFKDGTQLQKTDLITFKTAQKTFATLLYNDGVDILTIKSYMGFTTNRFLYSCIVGYEGKIMKKNHESFLPSM